ncbi:MAG: AarF/ABC1/UbiB kinase family protein [Chitinophagales bacterium]
MSKDKQENIPSSKVQRAGRFFKTGMKVSGNYLKHYSKKVVNSNVDRKDLDKKNAEEIFKMLTQLKGTALKIAQIMSMDHGLLPEEYTEKFKEAHFNNKALSGPLIVNTFKKYSGKLPTELFDEFNPESVRAASIGQVHEAWKDGQKLAVKIQYPGVADSIHSDINMAKPLVLNLFGIKEKDIEQYLEEVVSKLVEETDYEHELANGEEIAKKCAALDYITIPKYHADLSSKRFLTMDWLEGQPLTDFLAKKEEFSQEDRDKVGQQLLDFVHFQVHTLHQFHADLHPGNFFVMPDGKLGVLDFGCVKELPLDFYNNYFLMLKAGLDNDVPKLRKYMYKMDFLRESDDEETDQLFFDVTLKTINLVAQPLVHDTFYFGNKELFDELAKHGTEVSKKSEFRSSKAIRGPQDAIFLHRTFFGLYNILHDLNATVKLDRSFFDRLEEA